MVFSAYFCSRREVAFDLALMWVTLGLALFIWSHDPMKLGMFIAAGVSVTLTTLVVKLLADHVSAVISQLVRAADTDYLTGLRNRRAFDTEFRRQCDRATRSGVPLTLTMFDLDHFKQINDRHGHAGGDRVLRDFATLLERELRGGDTLARVGGEEFAVVLFGVGLDDGVAFAERIGHELRERSGGTFDLPEGTVYPALHRLEDAGQLASSWADVNGRKRRVYGLTDQGAAALAAEQTEWRRFAVSVQAVVGGPA